MSLVNSFLGEPIVLALLALWIACSLLLGALWALSGWFLGPLERPGTSSGDGATVQPPPRAPSTPRYTSASAALKQQKHTRRRRSRRASQDKVVSTATRAARSFGKR